MAIFVGCMNLRKVIFPVLAAAIMPAVSIAQNVAQDSVRPSPTWRFEINQVSVVARRVLAQTGRQRTTIDSMAMRENITRSMADVLAESTGIFVKSYGRATLSTVSFRGTGASHTQVTWNGLRINSPMLGQVDFSMIPSYFVDQAMLYHGGSSVGVAGGGLGGAVVLNTRPPNERGFGAAYIQGIGSFGTWDEFLRLSFGGSKVRASLRVSHGASRNDFSYTNYNKEIFVYDDENKIIDSYYPRERNRNGGFRDFQIMPEVYIYTHGGDRLSFVCWYTDSDRGIPFLNTDYKDATVHRFGQHERTTRATTAWDRMRNNHRLSARVGYIYTDFDYAYETEPESGRLERMIDSRNFLNTFMGMVSGEHFLGKRWHFSANIAANQHIADCRDRVVRIGTERRTIGYRELRFDFSAFASARWRPVEEVGLAVELREELYGDQWSPVIGTFFAEWTPKNLKGLIYKASVTRNYRFPTLNDRYFMPGGNPDLRPERGVTYDVSMAYRNILDGNVRLRGELIVFDSWINDWIVWMPGFPPEVWSPVNIRQVHSFGYELKGGFNAPLWGRTRLALDAGYAFTRAINRGDPHSPADASVGKQLPYMPVHSANVTGRLMHHRWTLGYRFAHYSRRFTSTDNSDWVGAYYMSDISVEHTIDTGMGRISLKLSVNNIFDEEYEMVISRPMPGRNFGFFIGIIPDFARAHGFQPAEHTRAF